MTIAIINKMNVQLTSNGTSCNMDHYLVLIFFSLLFANHDAFSPRHSYGLTYHARRTIDRSSMRLLKDVYEASVNKNVVISPLGIFVLLSLYSTATNGTTRQEIEKLLGFHDYNQLTGSYEYLSQSLSAMDPNLLTFANKVCISDKYQLEDEFVTLATRRYQSEVASIDLENPQGAAVSVNEWADRKSGGNIKNPVLPSMFTPDTVALLLNVIYFQGKWMYPFSVEDTTEEEFHVNATETVMKPSMWLRQELLYNDERHLRAKVVQLPYKESVFSMVIVLPDDVNGITTLLDKFAEVGLQRIFSRPTKQKVLLRMPKFEIKTKLNGKNILIKEGVVGIFNEYNSGVVKEEEVRVSQVFQQACIKVDEAGTTAAAFTYFQLEVRCDIPEDEPVMFFVDRPFIYAILYNNIVLFTGTYTH